jgi:P27 family predicted phage terminase small subunit
MDPSAGRHALLAVVVVMRGRKPKSTEAHKKRGTYRNDRHAGRAEAEPGIPEPPRTLSADAKAEWKLVVGRLAAANLVATLDRAGLALYCQAWADYWAARKIVTEQGWTAVGSQGQIVEHPAVKAMQNAWARCLQAAKEFGMTPASRASIRPAGKGQPEPNADDEAFFGPATVKIVG